MSNRVGRMPIPPEMDALQTEIGRHEKILVRRSTHYRAVIPDAGNNPRNSTLRPAAEQTGRLAPNFGNKGSLGKRHRPTIPPVLCPRVTADWRSKVTRIALVRR